MPASLSIIPKSAPFPEDEIDLLNRVVGSASPTQRAWLSGFLAGATQHVPPQSAAPARPAEPLTIVFASESGNCERLAGARGHRIEVIAGVDRNDLIEGVEG